MFTVEVCTGEKGCRKIVGSFTVQGGKPTLTSGEIPQTVVDHIVNELPGGYVTGKFEEFTWFEGGRETPA